MIEYMLAANEPFNHLLRWPMNSAAPSGTSVSPFAALIYVKCHFEPAKGKMSADLYAAACAICHEANPRATMVSNLHALNHPTDYAYWKQWITNGKPGSLMPAFAAQQGGPLTEEQIDSLAKTLAMAVPAGAPIAPVSSTGMMMQPAGANIPPMPPVKN